MFRRYGYNNSFQYSQSNDVLMKFIKENDQVGLEEKFTDKNFVNAIFYIDQVNNTPNTNSYRNNDDRQYEREDNLVNDRITLLHAAAYYDSLECFCFLHLWKNMDIRSLSSRSFLPLHYACYNGSKEVVAYILSTDPGQIPIVDKTNLILCFAIHGGSYEILEELFKKGATLKKAQSKFDDPIQKGISVDNYKCCEVLMRYSEDYNNEFTPAMTAAKMVNPDLLDYFVKSSSDLAFSEHLQKSVFTLIFDISNGEKFKPLLIKWLTKYDDLEIEPPINLLTNGVCHWICKIADKDIANLMLATKNVYINRVGINDHLGPYYLANKNNITDNEIIQILKILISYGFDLNYRPERRNFEPTLRCFLKTIKVRYDVIEFLVNNGADPNVPWTNDKPGTILDEIRKRKNDKRLMEIFKYHLNPT